ncbi:uncharacterized protein F4822DRAFT_216501 [Hypoxylon trugodes]|uniref:uncharacterized protein n=1 Tax=Hypoxylon trugodes TaxID=326681 RepID=UPI00219F241A|nr:uncharacterized protein F4822DRAFT_216501 [Hypoxylon trugodes]KAI1389849.1 hypothetical protein F4822DRAFT_216501 [Hypoxylon trugodes]
MRSLIGTSAAFSIANLIAAGLAVTSEYQTCYRIDGAAMASVRRCDNTTTGHSACCSPGEVCYSNGVCYGHTSGSQDWLREGCTDHTWKDPACFDVCPWYVEPVSLGVRPCGGIDKSNQYCCDDGLSGPGSFACCSNETSVFSYNNISSLPSIIATIPPNEVATTASSSKVESTTTTSSITTQSTSTSSTSISSIPTQSAPENGNPSTNSSNSIALGAGLGVGLPVAAAIIGGGVVHNLAVRKKAIGSGDRQTSEPYTLSVVSLQQYSTYIWCSRDV